MNTIRPFRIAGVFLIYCALFLSCNPNDEADIEQEPDAISIMETPIDKKVNASAFGDSGIVMQAIIWDVPMGGTWCNDINGQMQGWADVGIHSSGSRPPGKGESGPYPAYGHDQP